MNTSTFAAPGKFLRDLGDGVIVPDPRLNGFGGLHGGLTLALLTSTLQRQLPDDARLRSASARMHRAVTGEFRISTRPLRQGRISTFAAEAADSEGTLVDASAIFAEPREGRNPALVPRIPSVPAPGECEVFQISPEFVPITAHLEIRPADANRPYAGAATPNLTAWIRLVEDDIPPDVHRLIVLMDGLAPAYAAILTDLCLIPTMELTVRPADGLCQATSPWVLLSARTRSADTSGWNEEVIDAWDPAGVYLGAAHQFRLRRG
jgi:hypothetical protein